MRKWIFIFLCFPVYLSSAQNVPDYSSIVYDVSGSFQYSSIWTGRGSLQQFTQNHPWSAQIDFGILKNSQRTWNYCNCYSRNGFSFNYFNFANPQKLGAALALSAFAEPNLILTDRFAFSLRGSVGFAYLNKVYDSVTNKDNIFYSAKLSYLLTLGANTSYNLSKKLKITASAQFNHISNGGKRDPNEGINFPAVRLVLDYILNPVKLERRPTEKLADKPWGVFTHVFGATRTAQANTIWPEERRVVAGINLGLIKRIGRMNAIGGGGEIYYDGINSINQQRSGQPQQTTVAGLSIQHCLYFGKLLLGQQFAWYITPNTGYQKNIYQRYTIEYEVGRNWFAGVSLKAHGDHSDYLALSTGYFFRL